MKRPADVGMFLGPPEDMPWGVSCVFVDLYGNPYNLVERPER